MSVFISYRRDGGKPVAEGIYDALSDEYDIFLDTESLKNGFFDTKIESEIRRCSDFIFIVTESIFNRCSEPNDWILRETKIAFDEKKNIVPIFIGVKSFPDNIPESIKGIERYNGIIWEDEKEPYDKLKSFLISNRRCIITAVKEGDRLALSEGSKNELKDLYRRFLKNGRQPTDITVQLQNKKEISSLIIGQFKCEPGQEEYIAEQALLRREEYNRKVLETAFEYMLQDINLEDCANKLQDEYIAKNGASEIFFVDEKGIDRFYTLPYLWIDIIEQLFKVFVESSIYVTGANTNRIPIDCFVKLISGQTLWYFGSCVLKTNDPEYEEFKSIIDMPGGYAIYNDVPIHSLAYRIYPDLYLHIGKLKHGQLGNESFDKISKYPHVFNLRYYLFGRH